MTSAPTSISLSLFYSDVSVCLASVPSHSAQQGLHLRLCPVVTEHLGGAAMCLSASTVGSVFCVS